MKPFALAVLLCGCASNPEPVQPPPVERIRCLAFGHVPESAWWVYVCTFEGDTIVLPRPQEPNTA